MQQTRAARRSAAGPHSYEIYRNTSFFSSLDGLRCLSILAVIWHHAGVPIDGLDLTRQGYRGVDLFFAISGFLITTLLLREHEKLGRISLRAFYIRRTLRIFPLYYAVILLYVIVVWLLERNTAASQEFFSNLPYFLTYTSNWFVPLDGRVIFYFAWSLATEEQFYLLWPTVEKFLRGWRAVGLIVVLLTIRELIAGAATSGFLAPDNLAVVIILSIYPPLLGGVVLAHILHDRRTFGFAKVVLGGRFTALLLLASLLVAAELSLPQEYLWALMVALVGSVVICESNSLNSMLTWRPIAHVGMVSYGIYLMHMLVYNGFRKVFAPIGLDYWWFLFPATVVVATLVATISYLYYESWFLRQKSRFVRLPPTKPAVAIPEVR
jgi:peptidoglycan/LPS O-acetylase OafA/YrhL